MPGPRIAVLDDYQRVAGSSADWSGLDVEFFHGHLGDEKAVAEALTGFEIVCLMRERTPFPRTLIERLPGLRLLVTTGMVNASIDLEAAAEQGVAVCGTNAGHPSTPELVWALILALARRIPEEDRAIREGGWQSTLGVALRGRTLGILGLGGIGRAVAAIGAAFGMELIAWSQNLTTEAAAQCGAELVSRDDLFRRADVLTVHLRLSTRTAGLVGARELALMKPTSFLVNTSRGPIVDERALLDALRSGAIAGAALDVYDREPLPLDSPVRRAPNTVLTPHLGYVTDASYATLYAETVEDVRAFLAGSPIRRLS
jgi:phosphoglycerate dehydrogenase-like enzyme